MQIRQGLDNSSIVLIVYTNKYLKLNDYITLDHGHEGEKILCNMHRRVNFEAMAPVTWSDFLCIKINNQIFKYTTVISSNTWKKFQLFENNQKNFK